MTKDSPYEPLDKVSKEFRIPWFRCPVEKDELKNLTVRSDLRGLIQSVGFLALLVCTGALTYYCFVRELWLGFGLALFAHGTFMAFTRAGKHELTHNSVFKSKWLNELFIRIFALLSWQNFHHFRISHKYHHMYTLHPRADREVVLPMYPSLEPLYLLQLFTFNITGGPESVGFIPTVKRVFKSAVLGIFDDEWSNAIFDAAKEEERRKAINWDRFVLLFHLGVIVLSVILGLWALPLVVSFAIFIGGWWRYFVGMPMHIGLRDNVDDFRKCVRTITLDPFSRFLYWQMNYHIEHHMYAAVPFYNLRKLYRATADCMPAPRSLTEAWREMRETWKKQQEDPSYQFDAPVPSAPA